MRPSPTMYRTTLLLCALAIALLHVALWEGQESPVLSLVELGLTLSVSVVVARRLNRNLATTASFPVHVSVYLLALMMAPTMVALVARTWWTVAEPWEVTIAYSLRNVAFGAALLATHVAQQRLACLTSVLLLLFGFLLSLNPATIALTSLYVLIGSWWLLGSYWDQLSDRFPSRTEQRIPRGAGAGAIVTVALLAVCLVFALRGRAATTALAGFFPSSGGAAWTDNHARGGVGDGEQLVSAERNATTFGPLESEQFLESEQPSLYDMINDSYNEPVKCNPTQRAIPLSTRILPNEESPRASSERASREFEAVRQRTAKRRVAERDASNRAVLGVIGRTPLHLRLESFNHWDGARLSHRIDTAAPQQRLTLRKDGARNWVDVASPPAWLAGGEERHALRVLHLATNRVPAPAQLTSVHVDRLHSAEMFALADDGHLKMDRDRMPSLTVLHLASSPPSAFSLYNWQEPNAIMPAAPFSPRIAALARAWTNDVPAGWLQVEAICARLRAEYRLDPTALPVNVAGDPVEHFLFDARRGPDYLFATAAALLLRELGYQTRVATGFYADPRRYDPRTRQTSVMPEDVHFWTEVLGPENVWLTVEPTPGYEALYARADVWEHALGALLACRDAIWTARWFLALAAISTAIVCWFRLQISYFLFACAWPWLRRTRPQRLVLLTLSALDILARLARRRRPKGMTWWQWYRSTPKVRPPVAFQSVTAWALYGGQANCPVAMDQVAPICRAALRDFAQALTQIPRSRDSKELVVS